MPTENSVPYSARAGIILGENPGAASRSSSRSVRPGDEVAEELAGEREQRAEPRTTGPRKAAATRVLARFRFLFFTALPPLLGTCGGTLTECDLSFPRMKPRGLHTDEDTISLLRRLAVHYPDEVIAGILNRQGRKTANGERFTANQVGSLRRYRNIARYEPPAEPPAGQVVPIRQAAQILGINTSTVHRWLNDGFIAGEQITPGAPWQIRITDELRARFVEQAPPDYLPMLEATMKLRVSRQTVLQRVKRGELEAVLLTRGRRKGLRIKIVDDQPGLFHEEGGIV